MPDPANTTDWNASLTKFWHNLSSIPEIVSHNVPAFFGFAAADYIAAMAMSMVPQVGGIVGLGERAAIYGAMKVVDHATWQAFNVPVASTVTRNP